MIELNPEFQTMILKILQQYFAGYEVWAFGSRVTGRAKRYSDLDLVVISDLPLDFGLLGEARDAFSESDLPFKVDLLDWTAISPEFREIIQRRYEVIKAKE